ncbi:hypothetical protein ACFLVH_01010 [Chloroflexota bacterium]
MLSFTVGRSGYITDDQTPGLGAIINIQQLETFIEKIQDSLPNLDFEGKRLALNMLGIKVWLDGETVEIAGTIDPENAAVVTTDS